METSVEQVADDWIAFAKVGDPDRMPEDIFDRGWVLYDLSFENPELAWVVIQNVVARYSESALFTEEETEGRKVLGNLAAGPLEDLLAEHGPNFIDRVETEARRDRRLFWTLGCVWKNSMTDDVWARVQRAAGGMSR
jgi:hypothetical protein